MARTLREVESAKAKRWPYRAIRAAMFLLGAFLIVGGCWDSALAAQHGQITYNDQRVAEVVNGVLTYMEGSLGAMVMVGCGIFTICAAAFGQYRVAIGLMIVAIGSFTLRSFMGTFFNDVNITNGDAPTSAKSEARSGIAIAAKEHGEAVDVYVRVGTEVVAYESGEISFAGSKEPFGNQVLITHPNDLQSFYGDLDKVDVNAGQKVQKGQHIGTVGLTGEARGKASHLHFEIRQGEKAQSFRNYFPEAQVGNDGKVTNPEVLNGKLVNTTVVAKTSTKKKRSTAGGAPPSGYTSF